MSRPLGEPMLKKVRQLIESVNDTLKGQLDLEGHGGRSYAGVAIRVASASWPWPPHLAQQQTAAGHPILIA